MDHSYSTEREKVQKTDHSYFTVAKKTPKVVLRKAQLMKEHQESRSRTSIGQDHSYVRPDHVIQLAEVAVDDGDVDAFIPNLPKNDAQTLFSQLDNRKVCDALRSSETSPSPRVRSVADRPSIVDSICFEETRLRGCDLDFIDTQISDIRLDHAYDLKIRACAHRRSLPPTIRSRVADQSSAAPCRDQLLSLRLHDHTYLGTKA